jgi:hypothetical protein
MISITEEEKYTKALDLMLEIGEFYKEDNWIFVKKYIIRYSHPSVRKILSTRNPVSKKHTLNDTEKSLIKDYFNVIGIKLKLYEEYKHKE